MKIEFDPAKNRRNVAFGRPSFELVADFDLDSALIVEDDRHDYGEVRYRAIGRMGAIIAVLIFTMRGEVLRVISLRIANRKERKSYDKT
ncbi:MAG TPA: BrnT family toxin [Rhizomicrobium sp.]